MGETEKRVVVVTDSSAIVPADQVQALGIHVVPAVLIAGGCALRDGVDISAEQVYHLLRDGHDLPSTASPSVGDFLRVYAATSQSAAGIVSIHVSSRLSAIYNVALTASRLVDGVPICVLDCPTAAMGHGFVVLEAARTAAAGASLEQVVARAQRVAARVTVLATLDNLEHLHRGGRIGGAAALLGTMLHIHPVICLVQARVEVLARPRTRSAAIQAILHQMDLQVGSQPVRAAVLHASVPEEAEALRRQLAGRFDCLELFVTELTAVMAAHTGPGVLGVVFYAE